MRSTPPFAPRWRARVVPRAAAYAVAVTSIAAAPACAHRAARQAPLPASIPPVAGPVVTQYVMRYVDVAPGTGAPAQPGQVYAVHYTGWLRDGTRFDSSRDRGEPIRFEQGKRRVIPGWDAGFEGMRVGGRRRLFIPYQLAYGERGRGPIPPRAELIFDVELVGVSPPPPADSARAR
ncbi:MAG TPA: FKBP-type peptidyl-prolyl cis-trans isomerase [Gemmatirosa sp.]